MLYPAELRDRPARAMPVLSHRYDLPGRAASTPERPNAPIHPDLLKGTRGLDGTSRLTSPPIAQGRLGATGRASLGT